MKSNKISKNKIKFALMTLAQQQQQQQIIHSAAPACLSCNSVLSCETTSSSSRTSDQMKRKRRKKRRRRRKKMNETTLFYQQEEEETTAATEEKERVVSLSKIMIKQPLKQERLRRRETQQQDDCFSSSTMSRLVLTLMFLICCSLAAAEAEASPALTPITSDHHHHHQQLQQPQLWRSDRQVASAYHSTASSSLDKLANNEKSFVLLGGALPENQQLDYEVGVADQLVSADNDALFKCQLGPKARQLYQVIGWIEQQVDESGSSSSSSVIVNRGGGGGSSQSSGSSSNPMSQQQHQIIHSLALSPLWAQFAAAAHAQTTGGGGGGGSSDSAAVSAAARSQRGAAGAAASGGSSSSSTTLVLPDGQLLVQRAQVRDSNKSYRCQLRNQLTGHLSTSPVAGRLFVTESGSNGVRGSNNQQEQVGRAPRIIEGPKPITVAHLSEQLLLACVAQGSPRPTIRWYKLVVKQPQQASPSTSSSTTSNNNNNNSGAEQWLELSGSGAAAGEYAVSREGNFLLLKQAPPPPLNLPTINSQDHHQHHQRSGAAAASVASTKYKCVAENSFGLHYLETELKLEPSSGNGAALASSMGAWSTMPSAPTKLIELEPKIELISESARLESQTNTQVAFNCTIRMPPPPPPLATTATVLTSAGSNTMPPPPPQLLAIEWLKNGKYLFSIALSGFIRHSTLNGQTTPISYHTNGGEGVAGFFQDPNQELTFTEFDHHHHSSHSGGDNYYAGENNAAPANGDADQQQQHHSLADVDTLEAALPENNIYQQQQQQQGSSTLNGLDQQQQQLLEIPPPNYIASQTTLNKLLSQQQQQSSDSEDTPMTAPEGGGRGRGRIRQKLKLIQVPVQVTNSGYSYTQQQQQQFHQFQLLYQLQINQVRRSDRGTYQCRAHFAHPHKTLQASGQLVLKDNPPEFIETFASQLFTTKQTQLEEAAAAAAAAAASGGHGSTPSSSAASAGSLPAPTSAIATSNNNQQQQQHEGQVSLKCVASGSPLPEISWSLSGFPLPDSSRFRVGDYVTRDGLIVSFVHIGQVQVEDGGLYECTATNDVGQLRHSAWLNVTGPPYVRPMPNVSAVAGSSLAIMCPVGGWPIEQIAWFQNSSKLPLNHRQKLFANGSLIINDLNEVTDSGQYYCQARAPNSDFSGLNQVFVSIKVPPVLEPFTFAKSLHTGQRYNIMCTVIRGDLPVSIRWLKDGRPLEQVLLLQQQQQQLLLQSSASGTSQEEANSNRVFNSSSSAAAGAIAIKQLDPYSSTLTFASLQAQHRGLYTCEATNEAGRANQSSTLVIHVAPEWRLEPRDLSVTVDKTAVIHCQADGSPVPRVEWRLSQDLFREPPTEFKPIISSLYMRVFENGSLIIYNTQRSDAGYYLCQANNGVGAGLSRVIKLTVNVAAHFKSKIRTELVRRGQPVRLRCEAIGDLPVEINWLRDKMPLYAQEEPRYSISKQQLADGIVSELNIIETDRMDSALFTCLTQNHYGNDDTNIQLIVQAPPDPPLDIRIHEYFARSVTISWTHGFSGNSPITKYVVTYAQTSTTTQDSIGSGSAGATPTNFGQQQQQQLVTTSSSSGGSGLAPTTLGYANVSVAGNETRLVLSGLTPLTEYQFFLIAFNSLGSSQSPSANEPIKFRTIEETPNAPPMFVKAHAVSAHSAKVRWRAPERRAHYGAVTGFYVGYKPLRSASHVSLVSPTDNFQQQEQAATSSSSSPAASSSNVPDPQLFTYKTVQFLNQATPTPQISADFGSAAGNKSLSSSSSGFMLQRQQQQLEQECLLVGLKRAKKYVVIVSSFNSAGAGPSSEPVVFETWSLDVPEAPILRTVQRTARSIHLAWRVPSVLLASTAPTSTGTSTSTSSDKQMVVRSSVASPAMSTARGRARSGRRGGGDPRVVGVTSIDLDVAGSLEDEDELSGSVKSSTSPAQPAEEGAGENEKERKLLEAQANEPILGFVLTRKQLSNNLNNNNMNNNDQQQLELVETRLRPDQLSQVVDQLTCGTRYQFTVAAINSVGVSPPSEPLIEKTEGSTPVAPDRSSLLWVNGTNSVLINLGAWHNGTCAMRSFDIMYKASRSKKWNPLTTDYQQQVITPGASGNSGTGMGAGYLDGGSMNSTYDFQQQQQPVSQMSTSTGQLVQRSTLTVSEHHQQQHQPAGAASPVPVHVQPNSTIYLGNLSNSVNYDLKIIATNEAGSTEVIYTFNTNSISSQLRQMDNQVDLGGGGGERTFVKQFSEVAIEDLFTSMGPLIPVLMLLLLFMLFILSASCLLVARRRHASSSNCSLSLSSASRSNQSSSNYYTSEHHQLRSSMGAATSSVGGVAGRPSASQATTTTTTAGITSSGGQLLPKSMTMLGAGTGTGSSDTCGPLNRYGTIDVSGGGWCAPLDHQYGTNQAGGGFLLRGKVNNNLSSGNNSNTLQPRPNHYSAVVREGIDCGGHEQLGEQAASDGEARQQQMQQVHLAEQLYSAAVAAAAAAAVSQHTHAAAAQQQQQQQQQLDNIALDKSNYAYLNAAGSGGPPLSGGASSFRTSSPQNTELASLINGGSEAEMCLGASALNLNLELEQRQQQQQQQQKLENDKQEQQQNTYYLASNTMLNYHHHQQQQLNKSQIQLNNQHQLGKSSTLPLHCHQQQQQQQILQHLIQQQQQQESNQIDSNQPQQDLIDTLIRQQQQQQSSCNHQVDYYPSNSLCHTQQPVCMGQDEAASSSSTTPATSNMSATHAAALLLEQQLQQQVYATVKRGCPRPPRPLGQTGGADYTIYQCPNQQQQQQQQSGEQQMSTMVRCCAGALNNGNQQSGGAGAGNIIQDMQQQQISSCYQNNPPSTEQQLCISQQQQQQQLTSDYQQLRPLN